MKSIVSIGLGVFGVLLLTTPSLSAGDNKNAIRGGVGIGPVQLGTDITEVEKLLGKTPDNMILGSGARVWFAKSAAGKDEEFIVSIRRGEDGQHYFVDEVAVTSPDYRTPAGNSTGNELATIWREFPDLEKVETGDALDGTTTELYCSKASGVSVLVERPPGAPTSDKPESGVPSGKCRALIVQAVGNNGDFLQLGRPPKKADAD